MSPSLDSKLYGHFLNLAYPNGSLFYFIFVGHLNSKKYLRHVVACEIRIPISLQLPIRKIPNYIEKVSFDESSKFKYFCRRIPDPFKSAFARDLFTFPKWNSASFS
jgi:hypothetical protein